MILFMILTSFRQSLMVGTVATLGPVRGGDHKQSEVVGSGLPDVPFHQALPVSGTKIKKSPDNQTITGRYDML